MGVSDDFLLRHRDWEPSYLSEILTQDFYEFSDTDWVREVEKVERYSPIVEEISLEDKVLCTAVENTERE